MLWDTATGQLIRTFDGHPSQVNSVAFPREWNPTSSHCCTAGAYLFARYAFDLREIEGRDLRELPLEQRRCEPISPEALRESREQRRARHENEGAGVLGKRRPEFVTGSRITKSQLER